MEDTDIIWKKWEFSKKSNQCIIRLTNKCDQQCKHCCFRSGPQYNEVMSLKMCHEINIWVPKNIQLNIMGGEVTILENYPELLMALSKDRSCIRIVTNGFGIKNDRDKFFKSIYNIKKMYGCQISIAISNDIWHKPIPINMVEILRNKYLDLIFETNTDLLDNELYMVGRAFDNKIGPTTKGRALCKPCSSITIIENGILMKCPVGYFEFKHFHETTWEEAETEILQWRSKELKRGMDCYHCMTEINKSELQTLVQIGCY